jgi:hypothetical protein
MPPQTTHARINGKHPVMRHASCSVKNPSPSRYPARVLAIMLLLALSSCSSAKQKNAAEQAVRIFHEQFNEQKYEEIYANCSEDLRKQASKEQFTGILRVIHTKLGDIRDSSQTDWRVGVTTAGSQVALNYKTEFTEGEAIEQFVFSFADNKALVAGYHVNSPLLSDKN